MANVVERVTLKCSYAADEAREAMAAAAAAAISAGDLCAASSIGNHSRVSTLDVLETAVTSEKKAASAWKKAREAALLAEEARVKTCQMWSRLSKILKNVVGQMEVISKELQKTAKVCYTDEDVVQGSFTTQVGYFVDELAESLDETALECQVALEDTIAADSSDDDSELWEEVFLNQEFDRQMREHYGNITLGQHCAEWGLSLSEILDRTM